MESFITFLLTFVIFVGVALLINYVKSRPKSGKHQLTGMCHRSGDAACCSCSDTKQTKQMPNSSTN